MKTDKEQQADEVESIITDLQGDSTSESPKLEKTGTQKVNRVLPSRRGMVRFLTVLLSILLIVVGVIAVTYTPREYTGEKTAVIDTGVNDIVIDDDLPAVAIPTDINPTIPSITAVTIPETTVLAHPTAIIEPLPTEQFSTPPEATPWPTPPPR